MADFWKHISNSNIITPAVKSLIKYMLCPDVGLMLDQRRRRWANFEPTLDQRCFFQCAAHAAVQ